MQKRLEGRSRVRRYCSSNVDSRVDTSFETLLHEVDTTVLTPASSAAYYDDHCHDVYAA